jgi:hypothetical protein
MHHTIVIFTRGSEVSATTFCSPPQSRLGLLLACPAGRMQECTPMLCVYLQLSTDLCAAAPAVSRVKTLLWQQLQHSSWSPAQQSWYD